MSLPYLGGVFYRLVNTFGYTIMSLSRRHFMKGAAGAALLSQLGDIRALVLEAAPPSLAQSGHEQAARADYLLHASVTYLNHASIGTIPRAVHEAHTRYLAVCEENPWLYIWSDPWQEPREEVRAAAARVMEADPVDVALTHNTTEVFNVLAAGLPLGPGDEVLFSSLNHTGASEAWRHQGARRGYSVRTFDLDVSDLAGVTLSSIVAAHEHAIRPETRVLVLPHVDNAVGIRHPIAEIARVARSKGVEWVFVDAAQTVNMIPFSVPGLGVDAFATSAHKWTQAPKGTGMAWFAPALREVLDPMWVTWGQEDWHESARRYEDYGTPVMPRILALGAALEFQSRVSMADREAHHRRLWQHMQDVVASSGGRLRWRSPSDWSLSAPLYAVEVVGRKSPDVGRRLFEEHGIVLRAFGGDALNTIRISPNLMNTEADLHRLAEVVLS